MSKFIADLTKLDSKIYEWSDELWLLMVDYVIVFDDKLKFVFNGGNEIGINVRYYEQKIKKIFKHQLSTLAPMELSLFYLYVHDFITSCLCL